MKKTRILALVLAVLMLAGIFAGCAKTPASSTAPAPSQTTDSKTESQKPQELVDIVWYVYAAAVRNNEKNVVAAMNEYSKEKIGVTVTLNTLLSTDYKNKLSMDLASDADIDMMFLASWQGQQDLIQSKAVMDITDLLPNYPKLLAVMPEEIWTSAEFGGRLQKLHRKQRHAVRSAVGRAVINDVTDPAVPDPVAAARQQASDAAEPVKERKAPGQMVQILSAGDAADLLRRGKSGDGAEQPAVKDKPAFHLRAEIIRIGEPGPVDIPCRNQQIHRLGPDKRKQNQKTNEDEDIIIAEMPPFKYKKGTYDCGREPDDNHSAIWRYLRKSKFRFHVDTPFITAYCKSFCP